jgi:uncharacterized BrkB/YihY/UPF0761 family membrane protein
MSKATSPAKGIKPATKQRSTLLTVALVIVILHGIVMAAVYWTVLPDTQRTVGNIALWAMFAAAAASVAGGVAMWYWKRWGIYLYGAAAVVEAVVALAASGNLLLLFGALLPAIIVLYIVMREQSKFE